MLSDKKNRLHLFALKLSSSMLFLGSYNFSQTALLFSSIAFLLIFRSLVTVLRIDKKLASLFHRCFLLFVGFDKFSWDRELQPTRPVPAKKACT